jgi:lipoate-protein ligase A
VIIWCDGGHSAPENMRRDTALLDAADADPAFAAVLRLFRFAPPGITLGASQDPARELDLERCAADGIAWATRPTGGRAIFHEHEWTYSLAARIEDPAWGGSRAASFERVAKLLVDSLRRLGLAATGVPSSDARFERPRAAGGPAAPCFATATRHEIALGGRKLVGSAQRRRARALLQQGSVLLGTGHARLADYLAIAPEVRLGVRRRLLDRAAAAERLADAPLSLWADTLADVLPGIPRRVEGEAGLVLLTPRAGGSYAPSPRPNPDHAAPRLLETRP